MKKRTVSVGMWRRALVSNSHPHHACRCSLVKVIRRRSKVPSSSSPCAVCERRHCTCGVLARLRSKGLMGAEVLARPILSRTFLLRSWLTFSS